MCISILNLNLHMCQGENGFYRISEQSRVKISPRLNCKLFTRKDDWRMLNGDLHFFSGPGLHLHTTHSTYIYVSACIVQSVKVSVHRLLNLDTVHFISNHTPRYICEVNMLVTYSSQTFFYRLKTEMNYSTRQTKLDLLPIL